MATVSSLRLRVRRKASSYNYTPGFYHALDAYSSADVDVMQSYSPSILQLAIYSEELPAGCFLVERLISTRRHKVDHTKVIT